MGDGGTSISREEFNVALDTLKDSMTTKVESMLTKFLEGLKTVHLADESG